MPSAASVWYDEVERVGGAPDVPAAAGLVPGAVGAGCPCPAAAARRCPCRSRRSGTGWAGPAAGPATKLSKVATVRLSGAVGVARQARHQRAGQVQRHGGAGHVGPVHPVGGAVGAVVHDIVRGVGVPGRLDEHRRGGRRADQLAGLGGLGCRATARRRRAAGWRTRRSRAPAGRCRTGS